MTPPNNALPAGDYISPGYVAIRPDSCFPNMVIGDKSTCAWPHLRKHIPHNWYVDRRSPGVGFLSRDEAHILHNTALRFKGKKTLEIGCWMGWSAAHLALAGVELDVVDPLLNQENARKSVEQSLQAAGVLDNVHLYGGYSPQKVRELAASLKTKWSLIFIDGNHEGNAPLEDAIACAEFAEPDALILFHDLASPDVGRGIDYLRDNGWNTVIYSTMQIMGAAWRGNARPVSHCPDPAVQWHWPSHLVGYTAFGNAQAKQVNTQISDAVTQPVQKTLSPSIHHVNLHSNVRESVTTSSFTDTCTVPKVAGLPPDFTNLDAEILRLVAPYTMTSPERVHALCHAVEYIVKHNIPGDVVECGVWRGGSMMAVAKTLLRLGTTSRKLYLFDTFEGMPPPTEVDKSFTGESAASLLAKSDKDTSHVWAYCTLDQVKQALGKVGYDKQQIIYVKGKVEDTLPANAPQQISLLRLDTDWYESTLHELECLFPKLVVGGVLIIDDYGHWQGCRRAVDEYFERNKTKILLNRIDFTGRIAVKLE